jgi:hypothetical protein
MNFASTWKWRLNAVIQTIRNRRLMRQVSERNKVFCVGLNKTGTTSWAQAMRNLGYVVASETAATMLFDDWAKGDFTQIIAYCHTDGQAFQDIPFSLPGTYRIMDRTFPGSKFVLTVRDSAEQWYDSLTVYHGKRWSPSGKVPPTPEELDRAVYWRKGFIRDYCRRVFNTPLGNPYHRETLLSFYQSYNQEITTYFSKRPKDFLIVNVGQAGAFNRLRQFLGIPPGKDEFPWKNKT